MKPVFEPTPQMRSEEVAGCACACTYFCYCSHTGSATKHADNGNRTFSGGKQFGSASGSGACSCMCFGGGSASSLQSSFVLVVPYEQ